MLVVLICAMDSDDDFNELFMMPEPSAKRRNNNVRNSRNMYDLEGDPPLNFNIDLEDL